MRHQQLFRGVQWLFRRFLNDRTSGEQGPHRHPLLHAPQWTRERHELKARHDQLMLSYRSKQEVKLTFPVQRRDAGPMYDRRERRRLRFQPVQRLPFR